MLTIGQVAREAGLRASAIRFYEKEGLVPKALRAGGQRRYGREILRQLAVIEFAKECGFTLLEIGQVFSGFRTGAPVSERLKSVAARKIQELDEQTEKIVLMKKLLQRAQSCRCIDLDECAKRILARQTRQGFADFGGSGFSPGR